MAPHLTEVVTEWKSQEAFWIAQNGIKMSGMPASGLDHSDEAVLEVTAFVKQLPGMKPEKYHELTGGGGHGGGDRATESGGHHLIGGTE